jgi:Cu-Zn family superoxide dismutase
MRDGSDIMDRIIKGTLIGATAGLLLLTGAATMLAGSASTFETADQAIAVLHPTENSKVSGTVSFMQTASGVQVSAKISGLALGKHGFHIHQFGDCSAPDGTSAGGHYNPDGHPHAGPYAKIRHMGDLGNLEAGPSGRAQYLRLDTYLTLEGPKSIIGRAVIVHAREDDLTSQPTGNAGGRMACGVIGISRK